MIGSFVVRRWAVQDKHLTAKDVRHAKAAVDAVHGSIVPEQIVTEHKTEQKQQGLSKPLLGGSASSGEKLQSATKPKFNAKAVNQFLLHVANADYEAVETWLAKKPEFVLCRGDVTDLSNRTFHNITPLQYALWALDYHMWTILLKYSQYLTLAEAACQWRELETMAIRHGKEINWQELIDAYKAYDASKPGDWSRTWCIRVGGAQLKLPAHVAKEYMHSIPMYPPRDFTTSPPGDREATQFYKFGLGNTHAWLRGSCEFRDSSPSNIFFFNLLELMKIDPTTLHTDCMSILTLYITRRLQKEALTRTFKRELEQKEEQIHIVTEYAGSDGKLRSATELKCNTENVRQFLQHVANADYEAVEAWLAKKPEFVLCRGDVTDLSKRRFYNITPLQYALWALDYHMWTILLKYSQYLTLVEAACQWRELETVAIRHGKEVNWQELIDAYKAYDASKRGDWSRTWCIRVGGAQLKLPAHVAKEYMHSIPMYPPRDFTTSPPGDREATQFYKFGLGNTHAWLRGEKILNLKCEPSDIPIINLGELGKINEWDLRTDCMSILALYVTRRLQKEALTERLAEALKADRPHSLSLSLKETLERKAIPALPTSQHEREPSAAALSDDEPATQLRVEELKKEAYKAPISVADLSTQAPNETKNHKKSITKTPPPIPPRPLKIEKKAEKKEESLSIALSAYKVPAETFEALASVSRKTLEAMAQVSPDAFLKLAKARPVILKALVQMGENHEKIEQEYEEIQKTPAFQEYYDFFQRSMTAVIAGSLAVKSEMVKDIRQSSIEKVVSFVSQNIQIPLLDGSIKTILEKLVGFVSERQRSVQINRLSICFSNLQNAGVLVEALARHLAFKQKRDILAAAHSIPHSQFNGLVAKVKQLVKWIKADDVNTPVRALAAEQTEILIEYLMGKEASKALTLKDVPELAAVATKGKVITSSHLSLPASSTGFISSSFVIAQTPTAASVTPISTTIPIDHRLVAKTATTASAVDAKATTATEQALIAQKKAVEAEQKASLLASSLAEKDKRLEEIERREQDRDAKLNQLEEKQRQAEIVLSRAREKWAPDEVKVPGNGNSVMAQVQASASAAANPRTMRTADDLHEQKRIVQLEQQVSLITMSLQIVDEKIRQHEPLATTVRFNPSSRSTFSSGQATMLSHTQQGLITDDGQHRRELLGTETALDSAVRLV